QQRRDDLHPRLTPWQRRRRPGRLQARHQAGTGPRPVLLGHRPHLPELSRSRAVSAVVVALWLGACTKSPAPRVASPLSPDALRGASTPSAAVSPVPSTAAQMVARFTAAGLAVGTYTEFLAGHDPNPALGIPGVY